MLPSLESYHQTSEIVGRVDIVSLREQFDPEAEVGAARKGIREHPIRAPGDVGEKVSNQTVAADSEKVVAAVIRGSQHHIGRGQASKALL
jgi:hypothetical protein